MISAVQRVQRIHVVYEGNREWHSLPLSGEKNNIMLPIIEHNKQNISRSKVCTRSKKRKLACANETHAYTPRR